MKCNRCGGDLVDASPVEIFCPNEDCFKQDLADIKQVFRANKERQERAEYERLKTKYG